MGASPDPERYSNKAVRRLLAAGHRVIPVTRDGSTIEGLESVTSLGQITEKVDTLTLYVGPAAIAGITGDILRLRPVRVIMNPGAQSEELKAALDKAKIEWVEGCTLVMLSTGSF
ncbi:CoA-binding protein [bacterium]|nr:MAG: CoA-binding protein [bacterium]